jgi:hypothetical protein
MAGLAKGLHASHTNLFHGCASGLEVISGIEFFRAFEKDFANGTCDR